MSLRSTVDLPERYRNREPLTERGSKISKSIKYKESIYCSKIIETLAQISRGFTQDQIPRMSFDVVHELVRGNMGEYLTGVNLSQWINFLSR